MGNTNTTETTINDSDLMTINDSDLTTINDSELSASDLNVTKRFGLIPDINIFPHLRAQQLAHEQKQAVLLKNKENAEHAKKMEEFKNHTNYLTMCSKRVTEAATYGYNKTTCINLNPYDEAAFKAKGFHVIWEKSYSYDDYDGMDELAGAHPVLFWGNFKKYSTSYVHNVDYWDE